VKLTRSSLRQRMGDLNTSRTAGLVLEVIMRFLITFGSARQVKNTLAWSVVISRQILGDTELC
jgi:hypothetical protein